MKKDSNIYVKLQIEKDQQSGNLTIKAHFDPDVPNATKDEGGFVWYPTAEEIEFINEAFDLIPSYKSTDKHFVNKLQEDKPISSISEKREKREDITKSLRSREKPNEEPLERSDTSDPPSSNEPLKKDKEFEETVYTSSLKPKQKEEEILVKADEKTIDTILKRQKQTEDDGFMVQADEKTILDKVLKQKKRWPK